MGWYAAAEERIGRNALGLASGQPNGSIGSLLQRLDEQIGAFFSTWSAASSFLAVAVAALVIYPLVLSKQPDIHPFLLSRQGRPSPIRNAKESAAYRSSEVGPGYPLRTGLNVRPPGAPKWSPGKDGDLRDVWRSAVSSEGGPKGTILTVNGKDSPVQHDMNDLTKGINAVGQHLQTKGKKVAIYLPNCVEYLSTVLASAFYGMSTVLLPLNQPHDVVIGLVKSTGADCVVAEAGSLPVALLSSLKVKSIILVVTPNSRHMDWETQSGSASVETWHDLVQKSSASVELPASDLKPGSVTEVWMKEKGAPGKVTEFSQANIISAVAGLGVAVPIQQRITAADLVFPADHFSSTYVLCYTLAALYSRASVAINSVAGPNVDLTRATLTISPTIIIAAPGSLKALHKSLTAAVPSALQRWAHSTRSTALASGRMPSDSWLISLLAPPVWAFGSTPGKLRLILAAERAGTSTPPLNAAALNDLRIATGARISYALTVAQAAGAIAQSNPFDYRITGGKYSGFGPPLSNVEIKLLADNDADVDGHEPKGTIQINGPCVAEGKALLDIKGMFGSDSTLRYA